MPSDPPAQRGVSGATDAASPPVLASINTGSVAVAMGFGFLAALLFNGFFLTPFWVLLGRTLFVSMLLLLVFVATQRVPARRLPRWLPRWLLTAVAVGLTAPLATLAVYIVTVGGNVQTFMRNEALLTGFGIISATALVFGLLITLTAQLRRHEAQALALALELELQRSRLEKQALDARLSLLQAQIEPHFLFNTLANVQALVESDSPRAAPVLASLIAYLRAALPRLKDEPATLAREIGLVRAYLELMQMRMPDRLQFAVDVDPALGARRFPAMALLTLVENAVRHGIDPSEVGGRIEVGARLQDGALHLWVSDTGVGLDPRAATGTGLANLRERLPAFFGAPAQLLLEPRSPHGLRAEIVVPA